MRDIKFRAWGNQQNKYFNQDNVYISADGFIKVFNAFGEHSKAVQPPGFLLSPWFIIEQFIGITDKNGTDVYAGDIVETDGMEINGQKSRDVVQLTHGVYEPAAFFTEESLEAIGNVHEQPELLKERNTK